MLKRFLPTALSLAVLGAISLGTVQAQTTNTTSEYAVKEKALLEDIQAKNKSLKISAVVYLPSVDLYELIIPSIQSPTFTDAKMSFLLTSSELVDMQSKVNLTKRVRKEIKDNPHKAKESAIIEKLKKIDSQLIFTKAVYLPSVKIFELSTDNPDKPYTYVNEAATYLFTKGALLDLAKKENLSAKNAAMREPPVKQSKLFTDLPLDTAVKMTYGQTGKRAIAVFSDPKCPWCKKMDTDIMLKLKDVDVDIYYFMNPLNIPGHEDAPDIARRVLCAPDKVKAWKEWMLLGRKPENDGAACKAAADKHLKISIERGYDGTPVILTDTGFALESYLLSPRFKEFLEDTKYFNQPEYHNIKK